MIHSRAQVVVTPELVDSLRTVRGGYTTRAIKFITGGNGKPRKGWKRRHVGEQRSRHSYIELLEREQERDEKLEKIR